MLTWTITKYNTTSLNLKSLNRSVLTKLVTKTTWIPRYYLLNDLMWQDGLLIDFLQKKIADKWIRRFLIHSSYLYSERVLFKFIVKFYMDFVIWPMTTWSMFEFPHVASVLAMALLTVTSLVLLFNLNYLFMAFFN